jgi:WD40 repeat protein/beta-lactamase regulating signal transducer with metallopeptidase domain
MTSLVQTGLANAVVAALLAVVALAVGRYCRRPALLHSLWLLVLLKLVTPPLVPLRFAVLPDDAPAAAPATTATFAYTLQPIEVPEYWLAHTDPARGPATAPRTTFRMVQAPTKIQTAQAVPVEVRTEPVGYYVATTNSEPAATDVAVPRPDLWTFFALLWAAGSMVWFLRAGWHILAFQRLLRFARPAPPEIREWADRVAARLGFRRCPGVWLLPGALSPMVWAGVGRLRIYFPAGLLERLGEEERASLLAHELAHIRRRDHWVRWLEVLVLGLFWWYPLAFFARRRLQAHEEECCDAWVVAAVEPRVYAAAILDTLDFLAGAPPALPVLASGLKGARPLKRRLTLIMDGTIPKKLGLASRLSVLALAAALLPLWPTLAHSQKEPAPKQYVPPAADVAPEPTTEYRNAAINLVGGNHEIFSLAVSPDNHLLASAGGYWDTPGELKLWNIATRQIVLDVREAQGVASVVFSPDGRRLATGGYDHRVKVREVADGREVFAHTLDGTVRVAFSPDGKTVAAATEGKMVRLFDAATGTETADLRGDLLRFHCVTFSPDGKQVLAGGGVWEKEGQSQVTVWDVATRKQVARLVEHRQPILAVTFSPDGSTLATGGVDMSVRLWDPKTWRVKSTIQGHQGWVEALAFSPDGKAIASGSHDGTARLWDAATGVEKASPASLTPPVRSAVFSRDGKLLITGGGDRTIKLFDPAGLKEIATLPRPDAPPQNPAFLSLAIARDGKALALGGDDNTVQVREPSSGNLLRVIPAHTDSVTCVAYSPSGKVLATGSPDCAVKLWDAATGKATHSLAGHTSWVYSVAFSPDGKRLASGAYDKTVRVWDAATGAEVHVLKGHKAAVRAVAFSPDGKLLASGSSDRSVRFWDAEVGKELALLKGHEAGVRAAIFSPDGKTLATGDDDGVVKLWDVSAGPDKAKVAAHFNDQKGEVTSLTFAPSGRVLAGSGPDGVRLYDIGARVVINHLNAQGHSDTVTGVAFAPDGSFLVSAGLDRGLKRWNAVAGPLRTLRGHTGPVRRAVQSPDGRWVLSCGGWPEGDGTVRLWEVVSGHELRRLKGHKGQVLAVAFTPDSKQAVSGGDDGSVILWDLPSGEQRRVLRGHTASVANVAVSADGRWLLTASHDKTVGLWDLQTGERKLQLVGHTDWARCVAFLPDGKRAVSGGRDKVWREWDLETGRELRHTGHHDEWVESIAVSADGRRMLTGGGDVMRLWDLATGKEVQAFTGHAYAVTSVAFIRDCRGAVSGSYDGTVRLWDLDGRERHRLSGHRDWVWSVDLSADGRRLLTAGGGTSENGRFVPGKDFALRLWAMPAGAGQ